MKRKRTDEEEERRKELGLQPPPHGSEMDPPLDLLDLLVLVDLLDLLDLLVLLVLVDLLTWSSSSCRHLRGSWQNLWTTRT